MNCMQCEGTVSAGRCSRCGRSGQAGTPVGGGNAVTWPFYQPGLLANLWMPLAASFFWPFGILIGLGWSVDAIGRRARSDSQPSPRTRDLAKILKHGFVVMAMYCLYFIIPLAIILKISEFSWLPEFGHLIVAIWNTLWHTNKEPLWTTFAGFVFRMLANAAAPSVYLAIAAPLFLAGRVRYAITGKVRSFFNVPANIVFCFRHVGEMLLYLFLATITKAGITALAIALVPTFVGEVIPYLLSAANTWILAYLAGDLARVMYERDGVGLRAPTILPPPQQVAPAQIPVEVALPAPPPPVKQLPRLPLELPPPVQHLPPPAAAIASAQLYCCMGPLRNTTFPVVSSGYYIGRSPEVSQVILKLSEVSSRHVRVEPDPRAGGVWIEDMNSRNGTFYCLHPGPWQRLKGRIHLPSGGRFRLSTDAAEFEVREG